MHKLWVCFVWLVQRYCGFEDDAYENIRDIKQLKWKKKETETYSPSNNKVYDTRGVAQLINSPTIYQGVAYI